MPTILIIDDNSVERQTVQRALQKAGYTSLAAEGGTAGIEMAKEHHPDLIICDINMPELSGFLSSSSQGALKRWLGSLAGSLERRSISKNHSHFPSCSPL